MTATAIPPTRERALETLATLGTNTPLRQQLVDGLTRILNSDVAYMAQFETFVRPVSVSAPPPNRFISAVAGCDAARAATVIAQWEPLIDSSITAEVARDTCSLMVRTLFESAPRRRSAPRFKLATADM